MNDGVRGAGPAELIPADEVIGAERRAVGLAAHLAMAVIGGIGLAGEFPGDTATQATSFTHDLSP